mmetsp:Transcript_42298/g.90275  ORF Transcript_42298/g.90275 Transcript_42298/m.90275 type:complete len:218 (+) Transcript_42298:432-1085(+)
MLARTRQRTSCSRPAHLMHLAGYTTQAHAHVGTACVASSLGRGGKTRVERGRGPQQRALRHHLLEHFVSLVSQDELVLDGVDQRAPRGFDDVGAHADSRVRLLCLAIPRVDDDPDGARGPAAGGGDPLLLGGARLREAHDAHLVVNKMERAQGGVEGLERLAESVVERIDWAQALGYGMELLAVGQRDLDGGLGALVLDVRGVGGGLVVLTTLAAVS